MIEALREKRLRIAWLLAICVALTAIIFVWWLAFVNAPPHNAVLIESGPAGSGGAQEPAVADSFSPSDPRSPTPRPPSPTSEPQPQATATTGTLGVYVSGAVARPGVYHLPAGSRIGDAIEAAGGLVDGADAGAINLATYLRDEDHIVVGRVGEPSPIPPTPLSPTPVATLAAHASPGISLPAASASRPAPSPTRARAAAPQAPTVAGEPSAPTAGKLLVNINTASAAELEQLPGIGPVLAGRIVAYREQHGPFRSIEDLTNISGIKEGILSKIRPYITVGR